MALSITGDTTTLIGATRLQIDDLPLASASDGAVTAGATTTLVSATGQFQANDIKADALLEIDGDAKYRIASVTNETTLVAESAMNTGTSLTYVAHVCVFSDAELNEIIRRNGKLTYQQMYDDGTQTTYQATKFPFVATTLYSPQVFRNGASEALTYTNNPLDGSITYTATKPAAADIIEIRTMVCNLHTIAADCYTIIAGNKAKLAKRWEAADVEIDKTTLAQQIREQSQLESSLALRDERL
jgi:hypothetical protein